jgi:hypothetical protein
MERGFCVIPNVVAFYPQIKSTRLNEVLGVFWNPGAMYYVHINRLDYKVEVLIEFLKKRRQGK